MRQLENIRLVFFELLRAGLWEKEAQLLPYGEIDYDKVYELAEEQSVVGLITAGLERVADVKVPQTILLEFICSTLQIEQRNKEMNHFIDLFFKMLRKNDVYSLLIKGQGIAQCYERPYWRAAGDIDLLLDKVQYAKAKQCLQKYSVIDNEDKERLHLGMTIDGWTVELHGTLRSGLWKKLDRKRDELQDTTLHDYLTRIWKNGESDILLPAVDSDVLFVFTHILQHYYQEGIGLRQICDWCRLLWKYRSEINTDLLESRLKEMGILTEWNAFAAFAVNELGMPADAMPLYDESRKWEKKSQRIKAFILETGNFGHNRDYSYYDKYPPVVYKVISFWKHTQDFFRYMKVFPKDSVKVYWNMIFRGVRVASQCK